MSDVQANEEVPQDEESGGENETHQLREAYKRKEAEAKEGAAAKRELAFLRAGVDPDTSPAAKFFADHYDGELNAEAITESYSALGLGGEPAPQPEPEHEVDPKMKEDQATKAKVRTAFGSEPTTVPSEAETASPYKVVQREFDAGLEQGLPREALYPKAVGQIFEAFNRGDTRVMTSKDKTQREVQALRDQGINVD